MVKYIDLWVSTLLSDHPQTFPRNKAPETVPNRPPAGVHASDNHCPPAQRPPTPPTPEARVRFLVGDIMDLTLSCCDGFRGIRHGIYSLHHSTTPPSGKGPHGRVKPGFHVVHTFASEPSHAGSFGSFRMLYTIPKRSMVLPYMPPH